MGQFLRELEDIRSRLRYFARMAGTNMSGLRTLQSDVSKLQFRLRVYTLPLLSVGNSTQAVVWSTPMPDANYGVVCTVEGGTTILGSLKGSIQDGTITANGCTAIITNSGLVSIAAGAKIHLMAYREG